MNVCSVVESKAWGVWRDLFTGCRMTTEFLSMVSHYPHKRLCQSSDSSAVYEFRESRKNHTPMGNLNPSANYLQMVNPFFASKDVCQ